MIDTYGMDDINTQAIRELTTEVYALEKKVHEGSGGSDLPEPTIADAGKVLGVNDEGKYALVEGGGSGLNEGELHYISNPLMYNRISGANLTKFIDDVYILISDTQGGIPYVAKIKADVPEQIEVPIALPLAEQSYHVYADDGTLKNIDGAVNIRSISFAKPNDNFPAMILQSCYLITSGEYAGYFAYEMVT